MHYSGPPDWIVYLWVGCALATVAGSILFLSFRKFPLPWSILILVGSVFYTFTTALRFKGFEFPYSFFGALLPMAAGLLGLLGGGFGIWTASSRPPLS